MDSLGGAHLDHTACIDGVTTPCTLNIITCRCAGRGREGCDAFSGTSTNNKAGGTRAGTNLEHSFDYSERDDQIDRTSGGHGRRSGEDCRAQDAETDQFHGSESIPQYAADQLRDYVSVKERTQHGAS